VGFGVVLARSNSMTGNNRRETIEDEEENAE
jgi:hypothetical protein